jgi:hypothetical protein
MKMIILVGYNYFFEVNTLSRSYRNLYLTAWVLEIERTIASTSTETERLSLSRQIILMECAA